MREEVGCRVEGGDYIAREGEGVLCGGGCGCGRRRGGGGCGGHDGCA